MHIHARTLTQLPHHECGAGSEHVSTPLYILYYPHSMFKKYRVIQNDSSDFKWLCIFSFHSTVLETCIKNTSKYRKTFFQNQTFKTKLKFIISVSSPGFSELVYYNMNIYIYI